MPGFARAVHRTALDSKRVTTIRLDPDRPENTLGTFSKTGNFEGEGVSVALVFFDLDTTESRRYFSHSVDVEAWRWAAWVTVYDDCNQRGGS